MPEGYNVLRNAIWDQDFELVGFCFKSLLKWDSWKHGNRSQSLYRSDACIFTCFFIVGLAFGFFSFADSKTKACKGLKHWHTQVLSLMFIPPWFWSKIMLELSEGWPFSHFCVVFAYSNSSRKVQRYKHVCKQQNPGKRSTLKHHAGL